MKDNKKNQPGILERVSDRFDLPGEVIAGLPKLEILGFRKASIENHKGMKEYGDNEIVIAVNKGSVHIRGTGLKVSVMNEREIIVNGSFTAIEFQAPEA